MRFSNTLFAALHLSSYLVAATPFVIVSTRVQHVLPTRAILPRQGLLDTINSAVSAALGEDGDSSTAAPTAVATLAPPAIASETSSSKPSKHTHTSDDDSNDSAATSTDGSAATSSSSSSATTTSSTSALPSSTTSTESSSSLAAASTTTSSASADKSSGNGVPAGGVAVAVIMILLILGVVAFLIFRYNPRCQAWYAAREERLRQERSYREAIDGPAASSQGNSRRRTMLQSFFAPATVKLSENTEIRRKPVNWGAPAAPAVPKIPAGFTSKPARTSVSDPDDEKLSLTASAAPLGQIERYSMIPVATQLPAPPPPPKPLPSPPVSYPQPSPTFLPIPASGSFVAELPASVPVMPSPPVQSLPPSQPQQLPTNVTRNLSNSHGFGPELPATRYQQQQTLSAPTLQSATYKPTTSSSTPKTPTARTSPMTLPVSPMSLHPQATSPNLGPVSPLSTFTTRSPGPDHMRSISSLTASTTRSNSQGGGRREVEAVPMLPPLPSIPALIHAKRGSDGAFRLG